MKKRWLILLVCMVFLTGSIVYSVTFLKKDTKPKVVIVLKSLNIEYWKVFKSGADKAFDEFDIDGTVIAPDSMYPTTNQTNMLQNVLKKNPDALIVAPTDPSATIPVLTEYKKKNIPVLITDTDVEWKDKTTYIGTDNPILGKKAGELLGSMLQPGDRVALITGTLADSHKTERIKGAKEALEDAGIEIATEQQGYDEFLNVKSVMGNILQDYPDIKGVFAADDNMALDALNIIEEKGLNIPVVGADGISKMVKHIETGTLSATVAQNPYDMGYISVQQALKAIKGEIVPKRIDSGVDIITPDNAKSKLDFLEKALRSREGLLKVFES